MKNIRETIEQVKQIREWNSYVNKERFASYAKAKAPLTDRQAGALWKVWEHITALNWYELGKLPDETIQEATDTARETYEAITQGAHIHWRENTPKTPRWKIYYRHGEVGNEIQQMTLDLREKQDALKYALLLQQEGIEILHRLDYYKTVETYKADSTGKHPKIDIYDGDIIFCSDKDGWSWHDDSGAYLCTEDGYKRMMYTPGRGYLRRGEPDFEQDKDGDDCCYNSHVFNSYDRSFRVVGNIYVDNSVLIEKSKEE